MAIVCVGFVDGDGLDFGDGGTRGKERWTYVRTQATENVAALDELFWVDYVAWRGHFAGMYRIFTFWI
jgi:hypothetical protein